MRCCAHGAIIIYPEGAAPLHAPAWNDSHEALMWSSLIILSVDRGVMRTGGSDCARGDGVVIKRGQRVQPLYSGRRCLVHSFWGTQPWTT